MLGDSPLEHSKAQLLHGGLHGFCHLTRLKVLLLAVKEGKALKCSQKVDASAVSVFDVFKQLQVQL